MREQRVLEHVLSLHPEMISISFVFFKKLLLTEEQQKDPISVLALNASQCCGNALFSGDVRVYIFPAVTVFIKIKRKEKEKRRKKGRTQNPKGGSFQFWSLSSLLRGHVCQRLNKERKAVHTPQSTCTQTRKLAWRGEGHGRHILRGLFWAGPDDTVYRGQV